MLYKQNILESSRRTHCEWIVFFLILFLQVCLPSLTYILHFLNNNRAVYYSLWVITSSVPREVFTSTVQSCVSHARDLNYILTYFYTVAMLWCLFFLNIFRHRQTEAIRKKSIPTGEKLFEFQKKKIIKN